MDGRSALFCICALTFSAAGCVPSSNKSTSVEAARKPPSGEEESTTSHTSLFGSTKREPKVELALAVWRERKAAGLRDHPDQQFRELDEARKIYQEVLLLDVNNVDALRGLGRTYVAMGDFDRASATYRTCLEKHPHESVVYAEYSITFSKRDRFEDAIVQLRKALEIEPENQDHQRMLGVNLVCAGQVDQGVQALARARGLAAAHYYVARLLSLRNQPELARQHLKKAIDTNPNLGEAQAFSAELDPAPQTAADTPRPTLDIQLLDAR